jgi:hypothetical protein
LLQGFTSAITTDEGISVAGGVRFALADGGVVGVRSLKDRAATKFDKGGLGDMTSDNGGVL